MGCTIRLRMLDYFNGAWKMCRGAYWAVTEVTSTKAQIVYASDNEGSNQERKYLRHGEVVTYNSGLLTVKVLYIGTSIVNIEVWDTSELTPVEILPVIISNHTDKLRYTVGNTVNAECVIKNDGGSGTVKVMAGIGYIDSSNMIFITGTPINDQLFMNSGESRTFNFMTRVEIEDYYRQEGIGWAYLKQQMYFFFIAGHDVNGSTVWDTERHIKIYLDEPEGFTDPTSLPEVIGGIGDVIEDIIGIEPEPEPEPKTLNELLREFWDYLGIGKLTLKTPF